MDAPRCSLRPAWLPLVVMEILGHSQIAITMNTYTHVVQDTQREAVSHMDRLLKRRPSTG
jgi:integrase